MSTDNIARKMLESSSPAPTSARFHFEPVDTLGRGTFGKVVLARKYSLDCLELGKDDNFVAVKVIPKSRIKTESQLRRTETELRVLTEVAPLNQYLMSCSSAFQTDDFVFYVMECATGGDLRRYLSSNGKLTEGLTRRFACQIAEGLLHLHHHGVLYRDLKPDNILMDDKMNLKLTDFGLSKFLDRNARLSCMPNLFGASNMDWKMTRTACGTPVYQCPEMVYGRPYSLEADWWAFGNVIYEMLIGTPPFMESTVEAVHTLIVANQLCIPRSLSKDAQNLISTLLHPKRTRRLGFGPMAAFQMRRHPFLSNPWIEEFSGSVHHNILDLSMASFVSNNSYIPDFAAPSSKSVDISGCEKVSNDTFAKLVSTDSCQSIRSSSSSSCCSSLSMRS